MSIERLTMFTVLCDECGTSADEAANDGYAGWADDESALDIARELGWLITDDNRHFCHDCTEWDEEADERVPLASLATPQREP